MHRTEGDNRDLSTGVALFTDGPPGTTVTDDFLNAVQEELCNVIEQAGLTLKSAATDTYNQLWEAILSTGIIPRGYIDGLIMENAADVDHDITINIGKCRADTDDLTMTMSVAMTKQIDNPWAEGTNQGGFGPGGGVAAATWYHIFIIGKSDGSAFDAGFDTSTTAANLIAAAAGDGYSKYRRIGSVLTDGAANIIGFTQIGDYFLWDDPPLDVNVANPGVAAVSRTLSVPSDFKVRAIMNAYVGSTTPLNLQTYLSCLDVDDEVPATGAAPLNDHNSGTIHGASKIEVMTDTSSQIRTRFSASDANTFLRIATLGWMDFRNKDN